MMLKDRRTVAMYAQLKEALANEVTGIVAKRVTDASHAKMSENNERMVAAMDQFEKNVKTRGKEIIENLLDQKIEEKVKKVMSKL